MGVKTPAGAWCAPHSQRSRSSRYARLPRARLRLHDPRRATEDNVAQAQSPAVERQPVRDGRVFPVTCWSRVMVGAQVSLGVARGNGAACCCGRRDVGCDRGIRRRVGRHDPHANRRHRALRSAHPPADRARRHNGPSVWSARSFSCSDRPAGPPRAASCARQSCVTTRNGSSSPPRGRSAWSGNGASWPRICFPRYPCSAGDRRDDTRRRRDDSALRPGFPFSASVFAGRRSPRAGATSFGTAQDRPADTWWLMSLSVASRSSRQGLLAVNTVGDWMREMNAHASAGTSMTARKPLLA